MRNSLNIHTDDSDQIECRHVISESRPEGYPALSLRSISDCSGVYSLTIFPSRDRLERLHQVIGAYLLAHPDPADQTGEYDTRDILSADTMAPPRCDCGRMMALVGGYCRCLACGDLADGPVVAEAATG